MAPRFHRSWLPLTAILAVAAMVRCDGLALASYNFDEAFCWKMTTFPLGEVASRVAADNHPPLYFYLLWFWSRAFGDSPLALRLLSVLFGLATVAAAYLLVRQIAYNRLHDSPPDARRLMPDACHGALAAAALVALSHMQIYWGRQVRMYAPGAFLAVASCYLLLRAVQAPRPRWRDYAWYTLAATALLYTHYFGLFIVAGQFLYALGAAIHGRGTFTAVIRPHPSPGHPLAGAEGGGEEDGDAVQGSAVDHQCKMQIANCKLQNDASGSNLDPADVNPKTENLRPKTFPANPKLVAALTTFWVVGTLWSPWLPVFLRHRAQVSASFWSGALSWNHLLRVGVDLTGLAVAGPPRDSLAAWAATLALALLPVAMFCWGRGGLRLLGLCVLVTFDGAVCASVADRNIISSHYFTFAQALLLCGLPPLVTQLAAASSSVGNRNLQRGVMITIPRLRVWLASSTALAVLVGGAAWLCLPRVGRQAKLASRPGMMAAMAYLADVRQSGEPVVVSNPMVQIAAAGHAASDAAPRVLGVLESFPYFQGTAVMRPDECLSRGEFDVLAPRRVWVVDALDCFAGTWQVQLPDEWIDVAEEVFPGPQSSRARIIVRCYERRRQVCRSSRN